MAEDRSQPRRTLFRNRNFTRYLLARVLATLGLADATVAVGWQVYALSGRVQDLGFVGLAGFLPFVRSSCLRGISPIAPTGAAS